MNSSANLFVHFCKRRNVANEEKNYHSGKINYKFTFKMTILSSVRSSLVGIFSNCSAVDIDM